MITAGPHIVVPDAGAAEMFGQADNGGESADA